MDGVNDVHEVIGALEEEVEGGIVDFVGVDISEGEEEVLHLFIEEVAAIGRIDAEQVVDALDGGGHLFAGDQGQGAEGFADLFAQRRLRGVGAEVSGQEIAPDARRLPFAQAQPRRGQPGELRRFETAQFAANKSVRDVRRPVENREIMAHKSLQRDPIPRLARKQRLEMTTRLREKSGVKPARPTPARLGRCIRLPMTHRLQQTPKLSLRKPRQNRDPLRKLRNQPPHGRNRCQPIPSPLPSSHPLPPRRSRSTALAHWLASP